MADAPAFQFYAADFLADEDQRVMTPAEAGAYIRLICTCWIEGSVPTDIRRLAPLAGMTRPEMEEAWPSLAACFDPHPTEPDRLIQPRVEKERMKQATYKDQMAKAGKKGARRRWGKGVEKSPGPDRDPTPPDGLPKKGEKKPPETPEIPFPDTTGKSYGENGENGVAITRPKPGHNQAIARGMASDSSSVSSLQSSSPEELPTSRPPVSGQDGQAMARLQDGEREGGRLEKRDQPETHPDTERLWRDVSRGGLALMRTVLERWHQGQERVELSDGKSVGMGLEFGILSDLLWATEGDVDLVVWLVRDAPRVMGWDTEPRTLYWAIRPENLHTAEGEYRRRDTSPGPTPTQLGVKLKAVPPPTSPNVLQAEAKRKLAEARRLA